ncbi:Superoxide dismutase [Cu-Zn] [Chionoecetes opilio]|uniref:Superoxide dismutase [Cu-Zn] n=1 Tax=Chionoecetes opilio TaxID=41210 RepID=A0A8J4YML8_CHIOP|nr:Superoxide dismutase [Cu-Zn] [Chionoecetes opilio]
MGRSAQPATTTTSSVLLYTTLSWGGLRGNITFSWGGAGTNVTVEAALEVAGADLIGEPEEYDWAVHDWPIRYDSDKRCDTSDLGSKKWDLSRLLGKLVVPQVEGPQLFETDQLSLVGDDSIWGRAMRIAGKKTTCANLQGVGGERTYEARFSTPVGGSVWVRTWTWDVGKGNASSKGMQNTIFTDVFHTSADDPATGDHSWAFFITDILDEKDNRPTCNFLSRMYDPAGREKCDGEDCPLGDLTAVHGPLRVSSSRSRFSRKLYASTNLVLPDLTGPRKIYLAIMGTLHPDNLWACANLRPVTPKSVRAVFNAQGVTGYVMLRQESIFTTTDVTLSLMGLAGEAGGFHVHELPALPPRYPGQQHCGATKGHYNPYKVDPATSPEPGLGAHDQYELGDLSGKHGMLLGLPDTHATVTDHNLPLFGPRSVVGRGLVIHKAEGARWVCANLRPMTPQIRAAVTFRYPLVGEIVFEQEADEPLSDTSVLVTYLVYSDGSRNTTGDHRWYVHRDPPGRDFYNWTMRCVSAGARFNPYKVSTEEKQYRGCSADSPSKCELGDLSGRLGFLRVSGTVKGAPESQKMMTDANLPLSGPRSILGHSIVIFDDFAPKHRGDRMACMSIHRIFRHKGVVTKWSATRGVGELEGKVEFIQESEYDLTNTEVELRGLEGIAGGYHVHMFIRVKVPQGWA